MHNIYCTLPLLCDTGVPAWNAVIDDVKLLTGDAAAYTELVQKYGEQAVTARQKFLSEAECRI